MSKKKDIMSYWPMPQFKPRKSQVTTLKWIEQLPPEIKYILVEIPVGGGKSPLALNFSAWVAKSLGNSFVLTTQKILQKQYEDSFDEKMLAAIYGKSNYPCASKSTNCDIGSTIKPKCKNCPSSAAVVKGKVSPNMVLNYRLALLYFKLLDCDSLPPRDVMVFDECHTLEHHLTEFRAVSISRTRCLKLKVKYQPCVTMYDAMEWIKDTYYPAVEKLMRELTISAEEISDKHYLHNITLTKADMRIIKEFRMWDEYRKNISDLMFTSIADLQSEYVLVSDKTSFKFKELYGKSVFHELVKPMANRFLFMSSTILDKDAFCTDLGIDPNEAAFISLPSEFDVDNRPVIYSPATKMNYGWNNADRRTETMKLATKVIDICTQHADENGIIHTGSFQIADWLIESIREFIPHRIFEHGPDSGCKRDDVIAEFIACAGNEPAILISPSITEGLDLQGEKGRFAIFAKVLYPFLGDQWIKRRMKISSEWYSRQALISIIQGGGRIVRSEDDWGVTYILDASFGMLYNIMKKRIPPWWKDAYMAM